MPRVNGSKVLITGGSSGIGAEIGRQLGAKGCQVALTARRKEKLEGVCAEIEAAGGKALALVCDVTDLEATKTAFKEAIEAFGGLDTVILNAGIGGPTPAHGFDSAKVKRIFDTNVFGVMHGIEAILPHFLEHKAGNIVGISSLAGYRGLPVSTAYGASKAAVTNFFEGLRIELAPEGIRVITVSPGFVKSELTDKNKFKMPLFWPTEKAAARIIRGIEKHSREIHFPLPLSLTLKATRLMPQFMWDFIGAKTAPRRPKSKS